MGKVGLEKMNNTQDLIHGFARNHTPQHYIMFGHCESTKSTSFDVKSVENSKFYPNILFDSRKFGLHLHERTANTPAEREVLTTIPYRQGVVDMSKLLGHRIYENREITYVFYRFGVNRGRARDFQTTIENLLMREFNTDLFDSYEPDFHYRGKCESVAVEDDYDRNRLRVEITFNLYPFKMDKFTEADDLFDPFNFDIDALQDLSFTVGDEPKDIQLYNASQLVLRPHVTVDDGVTQQGNVARISVLTLARGVDGEEEWVERTGVNLGNGTFTDQRITLAQGMNHLRMSPLVDKTVKVSFNWRKERI